MDYKKDWGKLKKGKKALFVISTAEGEILLDGKIEEISERNITIKGKASFASKTILSSNPLAILER